MTQRFERRLPNTSHGMHDAEAAAQAGAMTLEELERYFFRAIVDDYQQSWDGLRRQTRAVLWEEAVRQTGVPQYLGAPDDLKLRYDEGCQSQSEEPHLSGPRWLTPLLSRPVVCVPRASQSPPRQRPGTVL